MMLLFLIGTLMVLLAVLVTQIRWVRKSNDRRMTLFIEIWTCFLVVGLICRFGLPFYKLEQETLRNIMLLLSALALIWIVLFSITGLIIYVMNRFAHKTITMKAVLLLVMAFSIVLTVIGRLQALQLQTTNYDIQVEKKLKQDVKMVMLSDLHLGSGVNHIQIQKLFDRLETHTIDVLVISGDLFDEATPVSLMKYFCERSERLRTRDGLYYVAGNHELLQKNQERYESMLDECGYQILSDDYVLVKNSYYMLGRLDKKLDRKPPSQIIKNIDTSKPLIVLDHRPDFDDEGKGVIDLQLSGHTHRGQIFPNTILTKIAYPYDYGCFHEPYPMIVSSGVGTWGIPIRLGSVGEIIYLNITS